MLTLAIFNLGALLLGILFVSLGFRHRRLDKPYISFKNPLNPFKYKDHFHPPGFRYHMIGLLLVEIGAIAGVVLAYIHFK